MANAKPAMIEVHDIGLNRKGGLVVGLSFAGILLIVSSIFAAGVWVARSESKFERSERDLSELKDIAKDLVVASSNLQQGFAAFTSENKARLDDISRRVGVLENRVDGSHRQERP